MYVFIAIVLNCAFQRNARNVKKFLHKYNSKYLNKCILIYSTLQKYIIIFKLDYLNLVYTEIRL